MYLLGYDVGSSSLKASLVSVETGKCVATAFYPKSEAPIMSKQPGFAEQDPAMWWANLKLATADILEQVRSKATLQSKAFSPADIKAIGISYQMHGLVCVDKDRNVLRPSIIWCDSRAVPYGNKAFEELGADWCLDHLLNNPGNFTAAKLAWVKRNEPALYERINKIMLPGDYIAMRLTDTVCTTVSGLSEGIFWDFRENKVSDRLLAEFGFDANLIPQIRPTFGQQGTLSKEAADAGTSGVVYGVNGTVNYDPQSRVNTFAHVNHTADQTRLGVLLCINGTGILNSWIRRNVAPEGISYADMNDVAASVPIGSDGVSILPFGNGAERMLGNKDTGCSIHGVNFNRHGKAHLMRAAQEGIVFSFQYGIEIMEQMGIPVKMIHAGKANMFLSPIFRDTLAGVSGATIELYDTDGSVGAAKGAGIGAGIYRDNNEAFATLEKLAVITPQHEEQYKEAYENWKSNL